MNSTLKGDAAQLVEASRKQRSQSAVTASRMMIPSEIVTPMGGEGGSFQSNCRGHTYEQVVAKDGARQLNGDMGMKGNTYSSTNRYNQVEAHGNSRQINGNICGDLGSFFK